MTQSKSASLHRTIIVVDVVGFTDPDRGLHDRLAVRAGMYEVLRTAFAKSGVDFDSCEHEDRGDGVLILLPVGTANGDVVDRLPERIVAALRRYNFTRTSQAQFKLRVSLNSGEVLHDGKGLVGTAVDSAFRIIEAPEAKSALAQTGRMVALISSERFFLEVIAPDPGLVPDSYLQITVSVKQFSATAYLRMLGDGMAPSQRPDRLWPNSEAPGRLLDVIPDADLEVLRDQLTRLDPSRLAAIMRRALGPAIPLPPLEGANDAWSAFTVLSNYKTGPSGIPPVAEFLHVLAEEFGGDVGVTINASLAKQARRLGLGPAPERQQIGYVPIVDRPRPRSTILLGNVPPRNPNFTGRDELLKQLGMRLTSGTTAVLPWALHGPGGLGKTQLAAEYVYRHLQDYDFVCWVNAAHTTQIRAGLAELAQRLGLPGAAMAGVAVPAVLEALRIGRPFRRWLLVFDAAESPDAVLQFFPRNGPGEILITSRNPDWAGIAWPLELPVFKREESIELLSRRGPEIKEVDADQLAEKLGDLPLAVEQAAAWRAVTGMPVKEYLRLFDESVAEILGTAAAPNAEVSIAAAWNVSFDELMTRNLAAYQILHICAFFSPEPISRDLFTGVRWVSISPELDAALRNPIKLARAIRDINRYGFAKIDHGNNTLQLHRLVQLILRNRVMAPEVHGRMRHGAHQLLAAMDPNDPESSRHWPRYRELLPHAYAARILDCNDSWPRQLSINLMRYLFEYGDYEEAARLATEAREHFSETLGPTHEQTLAVSSRLGLYLWAVGRYGEAAELNERTLALRLQVSAGESEEIFALQRNVTMDLRAAGHFVAGTALSGEIYDKSKRMFGEDDPETLNAAYQHGLSLRLSGDYRAAAELDEDTWIRRIEVLGRDHPRTFSVHAALIIDCREAGECRQARVMQEEVTERYRTRFGPEDPGTTVHELYLSVARRKDGDHNGASSLSAACLERFRLIYGEDHACTRASALAHSIDLRHTGDLAEAWQLGRVTSERHRMRLGEHHPHTLAASVDFAVTLRHQGDVERAREVDERALIHLRAGTGTDHPYAIVAAINLASDLSLLGDLAGAIGLGRDATERGGRILGNDHPTVLAAAFNLGLDLDAAGRDDEARPYQATILNKYRMVLGDAHPGTQAAIRGERADCDIDPMLM